MTRFKNFEKIEPILEAAAAWKQDCLLDGGSVFQPGLHLWTHENMSELAKRLPSESATNKGILDSWKSLLESAPAELKKLAAEVCWVQYLASYKSPGEETKRSDILEIYSWSGSHLQENDQHLTDKLLRGLGGPLQSFLTYRGKELHWLVAAFVELLELPTANRKTLLNDPDGCTRKLTAISGSVRRHSRHMLVFLLFPDERERSFSNGHRKKIAKTFSSFLPKEVSSEEIDEMPEDELDELLFAIRKEVENQRHISMLDWYEHKEIYDEWMHGKVKGTSTSDNDEYTAMPDSEAENVIYYGPPGTGKTRELNRIKEEKYTVEVEQTSEAHLVSLFESWKLKWWEVIALALSDFESQKKGPKSPREINDHPYVVAQGKRRSDSLDDFNFGAVVPGTLRRHRVGGPDRIQIFYWHSEDKNKEENKGKWSLIQNWRDEVPALEKRLAQLQSGASQSANSNTIRRFEYVTFHQSYSYEDFVEGIRPEQGEDGRSMVYRIKDGVFRRICDRARKDPKCRYAMFIDEINRGNISKIFGELITLLEPDKRARYDEVGNCIGGMELTLPYSGDSFGVPENLDMYGAMNTADRSIALLDKALRRRFEFKELRPNASIIPGSDGDGVIKDGKGDSIDLPRLLKAMNRRILFLLDREHMIGHSYFMRIKTFAGLRRVMYRKILPLLQEYFYEDWSRIQLVLSDRIGDDRKLSQIIRDETMAEMQVLGFDHDDYEDKVVYEKVSEEEITPDAIRKIYES